MSLNCVQGRLDYSVIVICEVVGKRNNKSNYNITHEYIFTMFRI